MNEAVRELVNWARAAANVLEHTGYPAMAERVQDAIDAVDAELNKSPAEQHQERLEEVLEWNR